MNIFGHRHKLRIQGASTSLKMEYIRKRPEVVL